jgi:hypothetical protein
MNLGRWTAGGGCPHMSVVYRDPSTSQTNSLCESVCCAQDDKGFFDSRDGKGFFSRENCCQEAKRWLLRLCGGK